ncbi:MULTISPECIES: hypothetical protein [unclassified Microbacterium]|uniref:hypothetical protein n=1 Tax=unclassified Microbacterium TaxID=2609290 RepID=UPI00214CD0B0|nr:MULTISPECIES: hypothetical protein [unclassified Microbacterium]MCR2810471.1 hypothetical protein [Microbacterium sp. zg.B185]WIM18522.1 hypothetical protein QNO12_13105 [Microbacterium sp. zg-B185]
MKKWVVRFLSLLVFNVVVLLVIGWLTPARVGWSALWAGVILTALTIWVKPLIHRAFRGMVARSAGRRTRVGEKLVQGAVVFVVALIVWILTVVLSAVSVGGWLWGYILPPVILLVGWAIYDTIDDRVERSAGALYDRATGGRDAGIPPSSAAIPSRDNAAARRELQDGLTEEQRRMLDELGTD